MDTDKIELKAVMNIAQVTEYLSGLIKGLKAGTVVVEQGDDRLALYVADVVEVEIEARTKKDKAKFSLEVSWRAVPEAADAPDLKVGGECCCSTEHKGEHKVEHKAEAKPSATPVHKPAAAHAAPAAKPASAPAVKVIAPAPAKPAAPAAAAHAKPQTKP